MGCLGTRGDSRGYPPWVHLFIPGPGGLARVCDWWIPEDKQGEHHVERSVAGVLRCQDGLPRVGRS